MKYKINLRFIFNAQILRSDTSEKCQRNIYHLLYSAAKKPTNEIINLCDLHRPDNLECIPRV